MDKYIVHNPGTVNIDLVYCFWRVVRSYDDYLLCELVYIPNKQYFIPTEQIRIPSEEETKYALDRTFQKFTRILNGDINPFS